MPQSYKTITRFLPEGALAALLLLLLFPETWAQTTAPPPVAPRYTFKVYHSYSYRFSLPKGQAARVWQFLKQKTEGQEAKHQTDEGTLTDLYFDTPGHQLLQQGVILRERLFISGEGMKQVVQLIKAEAGRPNELLELEFKPNKKPDKGKNFTSHPLLKLIRTKDRVALDSLLQPYHLTAKELAPTLELTQNRRQLFLRKRGSNWLVATFSENQSEVPETSFAELEIAADRARFSQSTPEMRQQLIQATDVLARQVQQEFPELQPEPALLLAKMLHLRKSDSPEFSRTKAVFVLALLAGLLAFFFFRKKFRKIFMPE